MKVFLEGSLVYQGLIQLVSIPFSSFLGFIPLSCSATYSDCALKMPLCESYELAPEPR